MIVRMPRPPVRPWPCTQPCGRKASTGCFAVGFDDESVPEEFGGWQTVCPSANAYGSLRTPRALSVDEIHAIVAQFRDAAWRAYAIGFDAVQIHAAHGYLLSQFLDPLINEREDEYGGCFENRIRMLVEVVDAVRTVIPDDMPVLVRISATTGLQADGILIRASIWRRC